MFDRKALFGIDKASQADEDELLEVVLEAGADDLRDAGEQWEVIAPPEAFGSVRKGLEAAGVQAISAELTRLPQTGVPLDGERAQSVLRLVEALEELDDVQAVYANFDIPEEILVQSS